MDSNNRFFYGSYLNQVEQSLPQRVREQTPIVISAPSGIILLSPACVQLSGFTINYENTANMASRQQVDLPAKFPIPN